MNNGSRRMKRSDIMTQCVLCGKNYSGLGNNAMPVAAGRCCDKCNIKVIMARFDMIQDRDFMAVTE
jgi:hypothetical protein